MKRLVLIGGPMAVGKTAVCRELKHLTAPCEGNKQEHNSTRDRHC